MNSQWPLTLKFDCISDYCKVTAEIMALLRKICCENIVNFDKLTILYLQAWKWNVGDEN